MREGDDYVVRLTGTNDDIYLNSNNTHVFANEYKLLIRYYHGTSSLNMPVKFPQDTPDNEILSGIKNNTTGCDFYTFKVNPSKESSIKDLDKNDERLKRLGVHISGKE